MKLSYRGTSYDFNPSSLQARGAKHRLTNVAKARNLGAVLTYRGVDYAIEPSTQAASPSTNMVPVKVLTYRGVSYTVQPTVAPVQPALTTTKAPTQSIQAQARMLTMNHQRAAKKRQQVMLVRLATEVGTTTAAASHWERFQATFNPVFQATYDRSHAALS